MGPAPDLATYEAQANATYAPQEQAEQTQSAATHQANLNTLGTQLSSTGTQYDEQEQGLTNTVQSEAAQIAQTYSTHLLGNFSGLQGNDMGEMFSKANQQEQNIETERTNAINAVNTSITNENLTYNANSAALVSKYQGLEAGAASDSYNAAVKDYDTEQYQQEQLGLDYAKLNQTASYESGELANSANSAANSASNAYKATGKGGSTNNGYDFTGPNGQPISLSQYLQGSSQGNGQVWTQTALNILKNGTAYDQNIYKAAMTAYNNHGNVAQTIANADTKNAYGLR